MKYNWNVYMLLDRLEKLKDFKNNTNNDLALYTIKEDIDNIEDYIKNYTNIEFNNEYEEQINSKTTKSYLEMYEELKNYLLESKLLWKDIKEFKYLIEDKKILTTPNIKRHTLSKKDILDLTHDFYRSELNSLFYGNFMKNFYRRNDHILFSPYDEFDLNKRKGKTIRINSLNESFIDIRRDYTIDDLFSTIHEYMHSTCASINQEHLSISNPKSLFTEIDAIFAELIAMDYFKNIFNNDETDILKILNHEDYCNDAYTICNRIKLLEYEKNNIKFTNNKDLRNALIDNNICNDENDEIIKELLENKTGNLEYMIGYIFAIELYYMYKKDKEKALYTLEKIIRLDLLNEKSYYNNIRNLGLIPNKNLTRLHDEIINTNNNILAKRKSKN